MYRTADTEVEAVAGRLEGNVLQREMVETHFAAVGDWQELVDYCRQRDIDYDAAGTWAAGEMSVGHFGSYLWGICVEAPALKAAVSDVVALFC